MDRVKEITTLMWNTTITRFIIFITFTFMELLTKEILDKFRATGRQEDAGWEAKIIVKFFTPDANATWYLTEYDENDKCFFGLCDLGL
jgi:hypothetical protein